MIGHYRAALHFPKLAQSELRKLFWTHSVKVFAMTLVVVFVPIYFSKLGYDLTDILLYVGWQGLFWALMIFPSAALIGRFGANKAMLVGTVLPIPYLMLLVTLPTHHWPLWVVAFSWGAFVAPYWLGYRMNFSQVVDRESAGRRVSAISAIALALAAIAPALGGILAQEFGISVIYWLASSLCIVAALPLVFSRQPKPPRVGLKRLRWRRVWPDLISDACWEVDDVVQSYLWPLFIFLLVPTYAGVGLLSSVIVISAIVVSIYVGHRQLARGERRYLRQGTWLLAASGVLRALAQNAGAVFGVNLLGGLSHALIETPFSSRYYANASTEPRFEYVMAMQISAAAGWAIFSFLLAAVSLLFPEKTTLFIGLLLAVPLSLGISRMR